MRKAEFKTRLWASRAPSKNKPGANAWRIEQPLIYWSAIMGEIVVPVGFETDFASVPRMPLAFLFFGDRIHAPAVIHDYLCVHHWPQRKCTWAQAAEVFHEAMKADGVPWYQRAPMAAAVRLYGLTKWQDIKGARWND